MAIIQSENFKSTLDYIERNLKTIITADDLAEMSGYSLWHYCRLFSHAFGMSVARYICKRRLDHALAEISQGRVAVEVVLEYGFETYAGFYKAFVKMYGCSPKKYLALYGGHKLKKGEITMFTEQKLREILTNWDILQSFPIRGVQIIDGSRTSENMWAVGDEYMLKTGEREALAKSVRVQKALAAQGFESTRLIPTRFGEDYADGEQMFILMQNLAGEPLAKAERFGENRREFGMKYGKSLARLHTVLAHVEPDIMPDEFELYKSITEWAIPNVRKQNEQWKLGLRDAFFDDYIEAFGVLCPKLPRQLIHRDPNPTNILFAGGEVTGFREFDLSERNMRLWDVCYCATGILSEWRGVDDIYDKWLPILDGIIRGYDSENPLTADEKASVYYVICSIQLTCVAYFESIDEFRELAKTNREMLQFIVANRGAIEALSKF